MSVQRWDFQGSDACMCREDNGAYVLAEDHEAAIHEAVADAYQAGYLLGQRAEREQCALEVEKLAPLLNVATWKGGYDCCGCSTLDQLHADAVAAIRARGESA